MSFESKTERPTRRVAGEDGDFLIVLVCPVPVESAISPQPVPDAAQTHGPPRPTISRNIKSHSRAYTIAEQVAMPTAAGNEGAQLATSSPIGPTSTRAVYTNFEKVLTTEPPA